MYLLEKVPRYLRAYLQLLGKNHRARLSAFTSWVILAWGHDQYRLPR